MVGRYLKDIVVGGVVINGLEKKMKKEENTTKIGKIYMSCFCGKHSKEAKNLNCEVYLRNHGKWTKKMEDGQFKKLDNYIRKEHPDLYDNWIKNKNG